MGKLILAIILILIIVSLVIVGSYSLNLNEKGDRQTFFKSFSRWIVKSFTNLKNIAGYAIKQDWKIKNETNLTNSTKLSS